MTRIFWKRFIGAWLIAFGSLQLTRLVFYLNLRDYFSAKPAEILDAFLFGFEFDAVTIAYLPGLFFVAIPFLKNGRPLEIAKWFFLIILAGMNLLNCVDAEFYRFILRRSTDDLFEFAFLSDDIFNLAPSLIGNYWYLLLAFSIICYLTYWLLTKILSEKVPDLAVWKRSLAILPTALVLVIAARGGFHSIPLSIVDAAKTEEPQLNALALNTPFTIIKTLGKPELIRYNFPDDQADVINPIIKPNSSNNAGRLKGSNVVVLIVESLSSEYVNNLNGLQSGYTPFVDSLCQQGLVFTNGFANGHRSIEGIAAVTASIPTLMYEPFTTSRYAGNKINSLASLLGDQGYYTTFMHGGNKNSMNFESFANQAGYDLFYDRDDYPFPEEHYDGVWGIPDHLMLKHCVEKYSEYEKPFFSTIFTLSSHHPYTIPDGYKDRFPKGTLPIHESIGYADQSLKEFFEAASKTDWYKNTLFVLTADHTSLSEHDQFQTKLGSLKIPIIFYHPSDSLLSGTNEAIIQQADIMPTILPLLGYSKPFFAFGENALSNEAEHIAVAFKHDQYQLYKNGQLICFDGQNTNFVYNVEDDEMLKRNILTEPTADYSANESYLKGFIQNYSTALLDNKMMYSTWTQESE